ncbi:hypothetical protein [Pelagibacterium montanilacus]|uniref:hypothetical protein n=1 Tax=Pelagibacterium montanilacus TaxID=2185280 RepID=UPI000F8E55D1|nr:hypothetical protein [Pelagibacterium montanilacus]
MSKSSSWHPRIAAMVLMAIAPVGHGLANEAATEPGGPINHFDCAAAYRTLSVGSPYLPGFFVMFVAAPRGGYAERMYRRETPPEEMLSNDRIDEEIEERYRARMQALEDGTETIEDVIGDVHICDAQYGHEPTWTGGMGEDG